MADRAVCVPLSDYEQWYQRFTSDPEWKLVLAPSSLGVEKYLLVDYLPTGKRTLVRFNAAGPFGRIAELIEGEWQ